MDLPHRSLSIPSGRAFHNSGRAFRRTVVIGGLAAIVVLPVASVVAALTVLLMQTLLVILGNLPLTHGRIGRGHPVGPVAPAPLRLSVQVPAHNEPPQVLIRTLACLRDQTGAPAHEIIVIINNTPDPAVWAPVAAWCAKAGTQFRFLRRDGVTGAKAGALNIALKACRAGTSHVVVLDADYQVEGDFLATVAQEIGRSNADFLQFPQAYRHLTPESEGLSFELSDYFDRHARAANMAQAMLLTGTLSVIRRDALVAVGGWPQASCTEDAELGTRLISHGFSGVFVDRVVGRGLMPLDIDSLHRQRHRWAQGNVRVLAATIARWMRGTDAVPSRPLQKMLVVSQLSAWLNLGGPALALLCVGMGWMMVDGPSQSGKATVMLALGTLILVLGNAVVPLLCRTASGASRTARLRAVASRVAMIPVSAVATVTGLIPTAQTFRVTRKDLAGASQGPWLSAEAMLGLGSLAVLPVATATQSAAMLLAAGLMLLPAMGAIANRRLLASYAASVTLREQAHG